MNTFISEKDQIIYRQREVIKSKINEREADIFISSLSATFDINSRIKKDFNIEVASNQLDDIEAICDLGIKDVAITAARAGGKTFGATIGISLLSLDMVLPIGLTAPTAGQANRIIKVFNTEVVPKSPYLKSQINWKECTNTRVAFKNGSTWESFSGSYEAGGESRHFALLLCFPKGTKIKMQDGTEKNIEDVTEGDVVISYDITSKQLASKMVLGKTENEADELIEIEYEADGNKKAVRCTPSHRIFTARGEIQAKDLREDDEIYYIAND